MTAQTILLPVAIAAEDMSEGHISSVAFHRMSAIAIRELARASFQDWPSDATVYISDIHFRFLRAVIVATDDLVVEISGDAGAVARSLRFVGDIKNGVGQVVVRFHGQMVVR